MGNTAQSSCTLPLREGFQQDSGEDASKLTTPPCRWCLGHRLAEPGNLGWFSHHLAPCVCFPRPSLALPPPVWRPHVHVVQNVVRLLFFPSPLQGADLNLAAEWLVTLKVSVLRRMASAAGVRPAELEAAYEGGEAKLALVQVSPTPPSPMPSGRRSAQLHGWLMSLSLLSIDLAQLLLSGDVVCVPRCVCVSLSLSLSAPLFLYAAASRRTCSARWSRRIGERRRRL